MKYLIRVFGYLRPHSGLAIISGILLVISAAIGLLGPWPMAVLVDNVLGKEPLPEFLAAWLGPLGENKTTLLILVVFAGFLLPLLEHGMSIVDNYVNTRIDQRMVLDFRSDLFQHALRLSMAFHDQRRSGMLIYAINSQADAAARLVMTVPALVHSGLTLIGMFWITCRMDPMLAMISLVVVPVLYYSVHYYVTRIQDRLGAQFDEDDDF